MTKKKNSKSHTHLARRKLGHCGPEIRRLGVKLGPMEELSFKIVNSWASTRKCWRDGKGDAGRGGTCGWRGLRRLIRLLNLRDRELAVHAVGLELHLVPD